MKRRHQGSRAASLFFALFLFLGSLVAGGSAMAMSFTRGDVDQDQTINVGDAVAMLNYLAGNGPIPCLDAADVNDDGEVTIVDPVYLLHWLFNAGAPPELPLFPCGPDPTPDTLDCASPACP